MRGWIFVDSENVTLSLKLFQKKPYNITDAVLTTLTHAEDKRRQSGRTEVCPTLLNSVQGSDKRFSSTPENVGQRSDDWPLQGPPKYMIKSKHQI